MGRRILGPREPQTLYLAASDAWRCYRVQDCPVSRELILAEDTALAETPETKLDVSIFEEPAICAVDLGTEDCLILWERGLDIARMVFITVARDAAGKIVARYEEDYYELENQYASIHKS